MSRAVMDHDLNNNELCSTSYSRGAREFFLSCNGLNGVYWDVTSLGPINWTVPDFNVLGNIVVEGEIILTDDIDSPNSGVALFVSGGNLSARTSSGQIVRLAPPTI